METRNIKPEPARFLVLLPHRDSLLPQENLRTKLFAAGFKGAYSFPPVALLAALSAPLDRNELKEAARGIRNATVAKVGKISAGNIDAVIIPASDNIVLAGPELDLPALNDISFIMEEKTSAKIIHIFQKVILCAAIMDSAADLTGIQTAAGPMQPFSFRAAVVTNLAIRPLEDGVFPYSLEWRLGPECWLPKNKEKRLTQS